jgi:hypothetical protein
MLSFDYIAKILSPKKFEALKNYCSKASVNERLDAALYIVNGDANG